MNAHVQKRPPAATATESGPTAALPAAVDSNSRRALRIAGHALRLGARMLELREDKRNGGGSKDH